MNKITKNSHYIVTGLLILIAFFGLSSPLIKYTGGVVTTENGFNMISFGSNFLISEAFLYIMYVVCVLQLILCVTAIVFFMIAIKKKDSEWEKKVFNILNWVIIGFLAAYMVLGFIFVGLANSELPVNFYSLSYVPALLGALVLIANYIFTKVNCETKTPAKEAEE